VDRGDRAYFEREVKPLLDHPLIEWVGEIGERQKPAFLGNALALLFPIDWAEPFGLVMIEAMACGTPVIAYPKGSVPEVIDHGVSGILARDEDEAVAAVRNIHVIDRARVRACFERRFTAERMAADYLRVYRTRRTQPDSPPDSPPASRRRNGKLGERRLDGWSASVASDASEANE
jgi:glycosyltransferase involved in cell wall biosynthesis